MSIDHDAFAKWGKLARSFLGDDFFENVVMDKKAVTTPKVDVYHSQQEVIVVMQLPGIEDLRSLQYQIDKDKMTISGVIPNPYYGYTPLQQECFHGEFEKVIPLGAQVIWDKKSIRYRRGVLEIRFLKKLEEKRST